MEQYQPVDGDPFTGASLQPVNGDPFAEATGGVSMSQGDYASAGQKLGSVLSQTWPARMAVGAYDAMMAPGDYMQGKISTEEAERQAFNAAGLVMSGGVLSGVERAAGEVILGSGPVLRVARRMPDGTVKVGQPGQIHSDLIAEGDPKLAGPDQAETTMGYVTPSGKYLDRNEALQYAKQNEPGRAAASLEQPQYGLEAATYNEPHLEPVSGDPFQPITAYHGSPHDFDAFDMSKIGTGEGAQAYGHGLYFAGNEGVARQYRENLANQATVGGKQVGTYSGAASPGALQALERTQGDVDKAKDWLESLKSGYNSTALSGGIQKDIDWLEANRDQLGFNPGRMYQVQINANPDHFLDWDKPLSEQSQHVQDRLRQFGYELEPEPDKADFVARYGRMDTEGKFIRKSDPSGNEIYSYFQGQSNPTNNIFRQSGKQGDVANILREAGIPGIKYLDAGSRGGVAQAQADYNRLVTQGAPEEQRIAGWLKLEEAQKNPGTRNYVVFNHDIINIIKKYGIGGLGIGTAAGIKHFQTQPVNNDPYSNQNPGGVI